MACILVVDDYSLNRHFLLSLLGYGGHRLLEAADGVAALDMVRAERPDLVISDILMPQMDGYEFVAQLRADPALADTPVIFYTATYRQRDVKTPADASGLLWVLAKPSEPEAILRMVQRALGLDPLDATPFSSGIPKLSKIQLSAIIDQLADFLKELEVETALARFGGNVPVYLRALQNFAVDARALDAQLPERVGADQRDNMIRTLHALKGMAGTIGASRLAKLAAQVQAADLAALPTMLPQLKHAIRQAADIAENLATRLSQLSEPLLGAESDAPPLREGLQTLATLLKEASMDALTTCEQLQLHYADAMPAEFDRLAQAVNRLDFQSALRVCNAMLLPQSW